MSRSRIWGEKWASIQFLSFRPTLQEIPKDVAVHMAACFMRTVLGGSLPPSLDHLCDRVPIPETAKNSAPALGHRNRRCPPSAAAPLAPLEWLRSAAAPSWASRGSAERLGNSPHVTYHTGGGPTTRTKYSSSATEPSPPKRKKFSSVQKLTQSFS